MKTTIRTDLLRMSITRRYCGHHQALLGTLLILENEDHLLNATGLYRAIAAEYGCNYRCVERNIRTVILHAWRKNKNYMIEIADRPLTEPPTVMDFLDILANHARKSDPKEILHLVPKC